MLKVIKAISHGIEVYRVYKDEELMGEFLSEAMARTLYMKLQLDISSIK